MPWLDLPKLSIEPTKIGHIFRKQSTLKIKVFIYKSWSPSLIFFTEKKWKDSINFSHWKMTLKIRNLRCSRRLFIILVSLTVTLFSEKMLISTRCMCGFMSNSIKKSKEDSSLDPQIKNFPFVKWYSTLILPTFIKKGDIKQIKDNLN